jgi:uncharacterized protein YbaR (Trm112 family)
LADFYISTDGRLEDKEDEKLLLIAMVEDLIRQQVVLRDGDYLIFPSQSTYRNPDMHDLEGKAVVFYFEGPVLNIYAGLAVRLSHSGIFKRNGLWKNTVTYTTKVGGTYGIFLHNLGEGCGELTLFFDKKTSKETRFYFEDYVKDHLEKWAIKGTVQAQRILVCPICENDISNKTIKKRLERGFNWLICPVCEHRISLVEGKEGLTVFISSLVEEMGNNADNQCEREANASVLQGKIATDSFDVFLCYNKRNKSKVKEIGEKLKEYGILPWLDEWELRPGFPWQRLLEQQIEKIKSAAVFVGRDGIGPWEQMEFEAFLRQFVNLHCPVIPVILGNVAKQPILPPLLEGNTWVDFRQPDPDPMKQLIWGITGKRI